MLLVTHSRRLARESKQKPEIHRIVKTWILKSTYTGCKYCCLLLLSFYLHLHFVVLRFVQYFFFRCSVYFSSKPYAHSMTECFKIAHNTYSYKWDIVPIVLCAILGHHHKNIMSINNGTILDVQCIHTWEPCFLSFSKRVYISCLRSHKI